LPPKEPENISPFKKDDNLKERLNFTQNGGKLIIDVEYIDERGNIPICLKILKNVGNLRLVGETGVGKTKMVHKLAEMTKMPLFEVVLTRDTSRWDLISTDILREGETRIREGIILLWLKAPKGILYLDGFNYAEPNIISLVESLADFRGSIWISELQQTFTRSAEHYLIISYNPSEKSGYSGTFLENIATIRRFEGLVIDYLSIPEETKLIKSKCNNDYEWARKWVEIADKSRNLYKDGKLRTPLTTGNLINYAKLHSEGVADEDLLSIAQSLFNEVERQTFQRLYEGIEPLEFKTKKTKEEK